MEDAIFTTEAGRRTLAQEWLPPWLRGRRWFDAKERVIEACRIVRAVRFGDAWLCAVQVDFMGGTSETYLIPIAEVESAEAAAMIAPSQGRILIDAAHVPEFRSLLFRVLAGRETVPGIEPERGDALSGIFRDAETPSSHVLAVEQSSTTIAYGDRVIVSLFRKLDPARNAEIARARHLTKEARFEGVPAFLGAIHWEGVVIAAAAEYLPAAVDGLSLGIKYHKHRGNFGMEDEWRGLLRDLGRRAGQMHRALAGGAPGTDFSPEPITRDDIEAAARAMLESARDAISDLENATGFESPAGRAVLQQFFAALDGMRPIQALVNGLLDAPPRGAKIRIHGDFHLSQVLHADRGFVIGTFEGEPLLEEQDRSTRQPPTRDVAGMLRSLAYLESSDRPHTRTALVRATHSGEAEAFLGGWREAVAGTALSDESLLPIFLFERGFRELRYELRHRPDWAHIPMQGLIDLCRALA